MAWDLPGVIAVATDRTAAYFNKYKACLDALALHTHSGADGDGAELALPSRQENLQMVPWFPEAGGNFTTYVPTGAPFGYITSPSTNQNDEGEWKFWLRKTGASETARISIWAFSGPDQGIVSFFIDDVAAGDDDRYNAAPGVGTGSSDTFAVTTDHYASVKLKMLTKFGSSSDYGLKLLAISIRYV